MSMSNLSLQPTSHYGDNKFASPDRSTLVPWSSLSASIANVEKLRLLCHSEKELKKSGYTREPLKPADIEAKSRCLKCGMATNRPRKPIKQPITNNAPNQGQLTKSRSQENRDNTAVAAAPNRRAQSKTCRYHAGRVRVKHFTCCGRHISKESDGCVEADAHELPPANDPELVAYWQFHRTPETNTKPDTEAVLSSSAKSHNRATSTASNRNHSKKKKHNPSQPPQKEHTYLLAVALDCEMGVSASNDSELIRLTAIDFFTKEILIDNLVSPTRTIKHYNTRYSGITAAMMRQAEREGTAILGRDRALAALWEYVGPDTVVVAHGGDNDFRALRWIHPHIVDSFILEGHNLPPPLNQGKLRNRLIVRGLTSTATPESSGELQSIYEAEKGDEGKVTHSSGGKGSGRRSLKHLCKLKLGIDVQVSSRKGHDSLEDTLGARELVVQWMGIIPDL